MKNDFIKFIKEDNNKLSIPNLLSLSRLVILPFIVYFIAQSTKKGDLIAFALIMLSGLTDFLDGYYARKFHQHSQVGKILDPIMDKINVGVIMLFLAAYNDLPYWYVFSVIGRDVVIMLASFRLVAKLRFVSPSNYLGKATLSSYIVVIVCYILSIPILKPFAMIFSAILIPASLLKYSAVYRSLMGKNIIKSKKDTIEIS